MSNEIPTRLFTEIPIELVYLDNGTWEFSLGESFPLCCIAFTLGKNLEDCGVININASVKIYSEPDECDNQFSDPAYCGQIDTHEAYDMIHNHGDYSKIRDLGERTWGSHLAIMAGTAIMGVLLDS